MWFCRSNPIDPQIGFPQNRKCKSRERNHYDPRFLPVVLRGGKGRAKGNGKYSSPTVCFTPFVSRATAPIGVPTTLKEYCVSLLSQSSPPFLLLLSHVPSLSLSALKTVVVLSYVRFRPGIAILRPAHLHRRTVVRLVAAPVQAGHDLLHQCVLERDVRMAPPVLGRMLVRRVRRTYVRVLNDLPKTTSGKVQKFKLGQLFAAER